MSILKEPLKVGGDRERCKFPDFQEKENKGDRGGLGCTLRDVGVPRKESLLQEEASGRLHGRGGVGLGLLGRRQTG